ncbi:Uncharacterised protein [Achromobacter xylosoxidans]|nr:Uncharacterised protein [Achromobacter xylosoxidans]
MDLHAAAAVAVAGGAAPHRLGRIGQQRAVQLAGRDVADHGFGGVVFAAGRHDADGAAAAARAARQDAFDGNAGQQPAAVVLDHLGQRIHHALAAALDHRHATGHHRGEGQLADQRRTGVVGSQAGVQHPRRDQRAHGVGSQFTVRPAAKALQRIGGERHQAVQAAPAPLAEQQLEHAGAIRVLPQQAEGQRGVFAEQALRHGAEGLAVAGRPGVQAPRAVRDVLPERDAAAVGQRQAGAVVALGEFQAGGLQRRLEGLVGGAADEQRVPAGQHVVTVAGKQFLGADAAAQAVVALQHQHRFAALRQQRRAHQRIHAAAHHDDLGVGRR